MPGLGIPPLGEQKWYTKNSSDLSTRTELIAADSVRQHVVTRFIISTDTAMNVYLVCGSTKIAGPYYFGANGGIVSTPCYIAFPKNEGIDVKASAAGNITVELQYYSTK